MAMATHEESGSVHTPVLLNEVMHFLGPQPADFIVDGTVDGGGHAAAIVGAIGSTGTFLGLDWDRDLLERTRGRFHDRKNVILQHGNYAELPEIMKSNDLGRADGLLIDLG